MRGTGSQRHTHKYHKINGIWYCAFPDCTHYMPLNVTTGVLGKKSICWGCAEAFVLDHANMDEEQPTCLKCSNPTEVDVMAAILREKGIA